MAETTQGLRGFHVGKQVVNLVIQIVTDIFAGRQFQSKFQGGIRLFIMQQKMLDLGKCIADTDSDMFLTALRSPWLWNRLAWISWMQAAAFTKRE